MLDGIRKAANNWLGRVVLTIIMGVLILSFAIWGIGDMLRVQGSTAVATVGKVNIDAETMRRNYTSALEDLSQRAKRRITNDEARAVGLDRQVLARLVSEAALDQKAKALGLNLSEQDVARMTMAEPTFKGASGSFDRALFYDALRRIGVSEAGFFDEQRRSMMRREIGQAIGADATVSQTLLDAAYRYVSEQRTVASFVLAPAALGEIAAPDDAALKTYFEGHRSEFRAPEYRKVVVLSALPQALGIDLTVTDADLRRVYDRGLAAGHFGTPAKRQVRQVLFPTEPEAMAAVLRLRTGTTMDALLTERKVKPEDADLGLKTKREFADAAVAEAAFALEENAISVPVKTAFGFAVLQLVKIDPGTEVSFENAKQNLGDVALADKLRTDSRIQARLDDIQKKVEEAKIAGKTLSEAAGPAGLKPVTIEAIDATGKDKAAAAVALPGGDETLKAIFQSDIGLDNEAIRLREGGLVWFEIAAVDAARDRAFDEVKPDVLLKWRADETARRLSARAADLIKQVEGGATIDAVAKEAGAEVKTVTVTRQSGGDLGATAAAQAFAIPVGKLTSATLAGGAGRVVMHVTEAKASPLDPASAIGLQFRKQLSEQLGEDLVAQYIQRLQADYGTTVHQKMFQNAIGVGSGS